MAAAAALLILMLCPAARAAAPALQPQLAPAALTVGDLLTYSVAVPLAPDETIAGPRDQAKFTPWEVRGYREEPGPGLVRVVYALTIFAPGEQPVPGLTIRIADARGKTRIVTAEPARVTVTSVLKQGDQKAADIVGPVAIREKPLAIALNVLAIAALVLALAAAVWFVVRRRRRRAAEKPEVVEPPDVIALRALSRLRAAGLPEHGKVKAYYTELSEILRTYLAARYGIHTLEETTSRIARALRRHWQAADYAVRFEDLLHEADLVKFAKARPDETACHSALEAAADLVRETAPPHFTASGG